MPTHKKGQDRDKYYQLAKDQGYRSRAAFKLIQINKRYDFLTKSKVCIDLCAAPGGWCQVAAKLMPAGSIVLGVDLLPIKPIRNVKTIVGDITTASTRKAIVNEIQGWKADAVLCDGAPNIGAAYNKDAFVQNELVLAALKTATEHLNKGGTFCTKVYRSVDYNAIVWVLQQLFDDVQTMKPNSSRSQSSEIFLVCLGYIAPKSIDPRLFDANHVFKEVADDSLKKPDVLHKKGDASHKRHRTGYDEALGMTLHPTATVSEFIMSKEPVRLISDVSELKWTDACEAYRTHPETNEELLLAMKDLLVLGKIDFKKMLKWRHLMRETFHPQQPAAEKKAPAPEVDEDEETRIQREITEMRVKQAQDAHREQKKTRKELRKERERQRLGMLNSAFEVGVDADLFAVDNRGRDLSDVDLSKDDVFAAIVAQESATSGVERAPDAERGLVEILDHDLEDELENDYSTFMKRRQMRRAASGVLEETERTQTSRRAAKQLATKRLADEDAELLDEAGAGSDEELDEDGIAADAAVAELTGNRRKKARVEAESSLREDLDGYLQQLSGKVEASSRRKNRRDADADAADSSDDDDEDEDRAASDDEAVPMRVTRDAPSLRARTQQWFANPLFATLGERRAAAKEEAGDDSEIDADEEKEKSFVQMPKTDKEKRREKRKKDDARREQKRVRQDERDLKEGRAQLRALGGTATEEDREEDQEGGAGARKAKAAAAANGPVGFEIVPNDSHSMLASASASAAAAAAAAAALAGRPERHDDRNYDSAEEDYDGHDRLLTLAMGTYMLRQSRKKALIDASYNRFAWNDPKGLPSWFMDDEMRHNKPQVPVPQALVDQIKSKYELTGTKVIKKVAEARLRKRKKAAAKLKAAKKQATLMAENSELSERQKVKAIAKAGNKYRGDKPSKVYVATRKTKGGSVGSVGGTGKAKGKLKFVDKRTKKDTRAAKAQKRRSKK